MAAAASTGGALAYVEADFFGGVGTQAAVVWDGGRLVLGPLSARLGPGRPRPRRAWPINRALRTLGVRAGAHVDEFEAADLGRHRETEDWAEAGWPPDPSGS